MIRLVGLSDAVAGSPDREPSFSGRYDFTASGMIGEGLLVQSPDFDALFVATPPAAPAFFLSAVYRRCVYGFFRFQFCINVPRLHPSNRRPYREIANSRNKLVCEIPRDSRCVQRLRHLQAKQVERKQNEPGAYDSLHISDQRIASSPQQRNASGKNIYEGATDDKPKHGVIDPDGIERHSLRGQANDV